MDRPKNLEAAYDARHKCVTRYWEHQLMEIKAGYCTLCRSRCGSLNHVAHGRLVAVTPNPAHPTGSALCAKGRAAPK